MLAGLIAGALATLLVLPPPFEGESPGPRRPSAREAAAPVERSIGRMEIVRIGLATPVREGTGVHLRHSAGHVVGSALPGQPGNVAVAGNDVFRSLRRVALDDSIRITTRDGVFEYVVRETRIADVPGIEARPPPQSATLTLIADGGRFVVEADLITTARLPTPPALSTIGDHTALETDSWTVRAEQESAEAARSSTWSSRRASSRASRGRY